MAVMRCCSRSRTSGLKARMVSRNSASPGITLGASPARKAPTVTMPICSGGTLRDTMVCSAITMLEAATTGSTEVCGIAPWLPLPRTLMMAVSELAIAKPGTATNLPSGLPGMLCMPNMASQGKRSRKPSSSMRFAPPWPSSAGWNTRCKCPSKLRVAARCRAAESSMAVWPSWPQACILPNTLLAQGLPLVSRMGSASMSARSPTWRVPVPARSVPTTPVTPRPRCTS